MECPTEETIREKYLEILKKYQQLAFEMRMKRQGFGDRLPRSGMSWTGQQVLKLTVDQKVIKETAKET